MISFITNSVYGHSIILGLCLVLVVLFSKASQADLLTFGMYLFITWYIIEFILVLKSETFWSGTLQLGLASLAAIFLYVVLNLVCEKVGVAAKGDGAGFGILMPVFLFIIFLVITLIIKGVMTAWVKLF